MMIALLGSLFLLTLVSGQPDNSSFGLSYPDPDTLKTYAEGLSEDDLLRLEREGEGGWTVWMDRDFPGPWGTGEFESVFRNRVEDFRRGRCHMWCEHPKAMELKLSGFHVNVNTSTLQDVLKCVKTDPGVYNPDRGYECNTFDQWERDPNAVCDQETCERNGLGPDCHYCPDVQVRYFCTGDINCMPAAKRGLDGNNQLRQMMKVLSRSNAEDMIITMNTPESPKRKLKEKKSQENEAENLLKRLLRLLRSEKKN